MIHKKIIPVLLARISLLAFGQAGPDQGPGISRQQLSNYLVAAIALIVMYCGPATAQQGPRDKDVFKLLNHFYTSYFLTWNNVPMQEKKLDSILTKYCAPDLLHKIKQKTDAGDLDYDPFLKAQDVDTASLKTITFTKDPKRPDAYTFSYVANQGKYKPVIHLIVAKLNGVLKITDVW